VSQDELLAAVQSLNADPRVTGVIIQRPVPAQLSIKELQQSAVHPLKDVEGMHPASIGNIVYNDLVLGPCTSLASVELLKWTGLELKGFEVVVIGHSEIIGKPIAFLLMSEGATVTVCHHMTRNLAVHSRQADAVFVAVGKPQLITGTMIKPWNQPSRRGRRRLLRRRRRGLRLLSRGGRLDNASPRRRRAGDRDHADAQHGDGRRVAKGTLRSAVWIASAIPSLRLPPSHKRRHDSRAAQTADATRRKFPPRMPRISVSSKPR
jgi:hypothetical protein